jgi:hypothetical protein
MRKSSVTDPAQRAAYEQRQKRSARIRSGQTPGLLEKDGKSVRPAVKALIEEALARRARG